MLLGWHGATLCSLLADPNVDLAYLSGCFPSQANTPFPAPITGAVQTTGMDFTALGRWHLHYGLEVGLAGLGLQLDFDLGGLFQPGFYNDDYYHDCGENETFSEKRNPLWPFGSRRRGKRC